MDVFAVSGCGHFLAAGLRDGSAQLVHVASRRILATFPLVEAFQATAAADQQVATFAAVFFQTSGQNEQLCLLDQRSGRLWVVGNLKLAQLQEALQLGDWNALVAAKSRLTHTQVVIL